MAAGLAVAAAAAAALFITITGKKRKRGFRGFGQLYRDIEDMFWVPEGRTYSWLRHYSCDVIGQ